MGVLRSITAMPFGASNYSDTEMNEQSQQLSEAGIKLLKIGFIGAGGTGKTTVAKILHHLPEPFIPSRNREILTGLGLTDASQQHLTAQELWKVQRHLIDGKINQDASHPVGLFDRTPIDHLAYCLHRCADAITDAEWGWLWQKYEHLTSLYDLLFYFPVYDWGNTHEDGFRQGNKAYRQKIDMLMQGIMANMGVVPVAMRNIPAEERAALIKEYIDGTRWHKGTQ